MKNTSLNKVHKVLWKYGAKLETLMNTSSKNESNNGTWICHLISNEMCGERLFSVGLRGIIFKSRKAAATSTIGEYITSWSLSSECEDKGTCISESEMDEYIVSLDSENLIGVDFSKRK